MKHKHTKALSVLLTVLMIVGLMPWTMMPAKALDGTTSGSCGSGVTWAVTENGDTYTHGGNTYTNGCTLTISGNGAMSDFASNNAPTWYHWYGERVTRIVIESGVTHIGAYAFGMGSQKSSCPNVVSVSIPDTVTSIGAYAFGGDIGNPDVARRCSKLTGITIPSSVTNIRTGAFRRCTGLTSVTIPGTTNHDTEIGPDAFARCTNLATATIGDGVKSIGDGAFAGCSALNTVSIGKNVESIDRSAFSRSGPNGSIRTFSINENNQNFDSSGLFVIDKNTNTLTACFKVPSDGVIKIPSNVTAIGASVFADKTAITSVIIPANVTSVGHNAFVLTGLTSVIAPAGLDLSDAGIPNDATITKICTKPTAPTQTTFVYNGSEQTCMADAAANSGYTVSGNKQTGAGSYTATVTLTAGSNPRYVWGDTSTMTEAASGATAVITYAWSIDKRDQLAPTGVTSAAISTGDTGSITGVDTKMEYGTDNESWTACTGATIDDLAPGVYYVRKAGNNNEYESPSVTVVVRRDGEHALTVNGGTGSGVHAENDQVEVSATAPTGMKFNGWTVTGADLSAEQLASPTLTVTMLNGDATLTASFVNATVTGVTLNRSSLPLAPGATAALTASYLPADVKPQYQGVTWSSNNESVATVDASGTVRAKAEGTATITVTATNGTASTDDDKTATCAVTVARPQSAPSYSDSSDDDYTPSKTETVTNADGSTTKTTTNADGGKTAVTTAQDGSAATVKTDKSGSVVSTEVNPSAKAIENAAKSGEPVTLPVKVRATGDAGSASEVKVTLPKGESRVTVEIPVSNLTPGTVAVIVHADGTEEIVKTSTTGEDGVVLTLEESATVKIVDNTKYFSDVHTGDWFAPYIAWAASRGIMNGMGDGTFAPNDPTTQGMMEQLLYNLDGNALVPAAGGEAWWSAADRWADSKGVTQGLGAAHDPAAPAAREADILMMFNYAKAKGYDVSARADLSRFPDAANVSEEAREAMAWAVAVGLINGTTDENGSVILDPQGVATRAQVAAIVERFCEKVAK